MSSTKPNDKMNIIVIEGLPSAGKTTFVDRCRTEGITEFQYIDEIANELKEREGFPGNSDDPEEVKNINNWFIAKESERCQRAYNFSKHNASIMDRSYFTHIPYSYAYSKLTDTNIVDITFQKYLSAINEGLIINPNLILYFQISPDVMIERTKIREYNKERSKLPEFWLDKTFLNNLKDGYDYMFSELSKDVSVEIINAERTKEEVYVESLEIIKNPYDTPEQEKVYKRIIGIQEQFKKEL